MYFYDIHILVTKLLCVSLVWPKAKDTFLVKYFQLRIVIFPYMEDQALSFHTTVFLSEVCAHVQQLQG